MKVASCQTTIYYYLIECLHAGHCVHLRHKIDESQKMLHHYKFISGFMVTTVHNLHVTSFRTTNTTTKPPLRTIQLELNHSYHTF